MDSINNMDILAVTIDGVNERIESLKNELNNEYIKYEELLDKICELKNVNNNGLYKWNKCNKCKSKDLIRPIDLIIDARIGRYNIYINPQKYCKGCCDLENYCFKCGYKNVRCLC
jgi:hypothetical protein